MYEFDSGAPWSDYWEDITSVVVEEGVESISSYAFCYLESLESVSLPASLSSIGTVLFGNCTNLSLISVAEGSEYFAVVNGVLMSADGGTLYAYPAGLTNAAYVIPDGVTTIAGGAFGSDNDLVRVTIPSSVTVIEPYAFYYPCGLTTVYYLGVEDAWDELTAELDTDTAGPLFDADIIFVPSAVAEHVEASAPTCTEAGSIEYWYIESYDLYYADEACETEITAEDIVVPALGHSFGEPEWAWAEDYSSATATFTCSVCGEEQTVTATITSQTTEATYETAGSTVYTAAVTFGGGSYSDTRSVAIPRLIRTGWQKIDGVWYYYSADEQPMTGWQKINNVWYWFSDSGVMQTGWVTVNGKWYYMNESGAMRTGWLKDGDVWYYLKASGTMAASETLTLDGTAYTFDASGRWVG